jgi:alkanesulfonate monooxygenase SsuD/methylene tetrahydromethanopterin reductase-like flavin-dependent oxidoreductase (luciferase family)
MDYRQTLRFGFFLTPIASEPEEAVRQAQLCDELGLDLIGIQDHPYQAKFMDSWTLLGYLAAKTTRIHLFPDVINLPLRPPAVLAKAAATLDLLSQGRFELGLGAGAFWTAIGAMGGPVRQPGEAVAALEEAIQIIRLMWSGQRGLKFEGKHYQLRGAHSGPEPAHPVEIWIGANGPRMLDLTGRLGDGWVPSSTYVPPARLQEMNRRIDEAALGAGRKPASIRRIYNLMGSISSGQPGDFLHGPVEQWVDELTVLALEHGIDSFILGIDNEHEGQLRLFAEKIRPLVIENVSQNRKTHTHNVRSSNDNLSTGIRSDSG